MRDQSPVTGPVDTGLSSDEDPDESPLHGPDIPPAISEPPLSPQDPGSGMLPNVSSPCLLESDMDTLHEEPRMDAEEDSGPLGPVGDPGEGPRRSGRHRRAPDRLVYHW